MAPEDVLDEFDVIHSISRAELLPCRSKELEIPDVLDCLGKEEHYDGPRHARAYVVSNDGREVVGDEYCGERSDYERAYRVSE